MFTWIPYYKELSEKLIEYKDRRDELVEFIYAPDGLERYTNYLKTGDGKRIDDIDPFSFFGIFNTGNKRNSKFENRVDILNRIKTKFGVSADVPTDFDSVPLLNYMISFYYDWNDVKSTCDLLWDEYEKLLKGEDLQGFFDYYNFEKRHSLTTMPLYWIKPGKYIALDTRNRAYLKSEYVIETLNSITDYTSYNSLCESLIKKIENNDIKERSISEISYNAYLHVPEEADFNVWFVREINKKGFDYCFENNCLCFNERNDQIDMSKLGDNLDTFSKSLGEEKTVKKSTVKYAYWQLSHEVKENDIIFYFKTPKELYGWGVVTDSYSYDDTKKYHHSISVSWDKVASGTISPVSHKAGLWFKDMKYSDTKPLFELLGIDIEDIVEKRDMDYKEYIELLKENRNLILTGAPGTGKTFMAKEIAKEMDAETEFVQFHPSYDYTDFVEGLRPVEKEDGQMGFERKDGIFKEFCKKAIENIEESSKGTTALEKEQSVGDAIADFLSECQEENTKLYAKPERNGGREFFINNVTGQHCIISIPSNERANSLKIRLRELKLLLESETPFSASIDIRNFFDNKWRRQEDTYLYALYYYISLKHQRVQNNKSVNYVSKTVTRKDFVFIIDEINRGEASKIFGELFFSIDPGYRGTKGLVKTQYQNLIEEGDEFEKGFYVPENVYILATMNDIDRSVESMDFAMRRRFTWKEVTPDDTEGMLTDFDCAEDAKATMKRLNDAIAKEDGLGAAYMVGPSYFLKLKDNGGDFKKLWKLNIEPLLKEYLRGFRKSGEILKKFENAYFNNIDTEA